METKTRCVLYLRTSLTSQHTDNQRPEVVQLARTRGFEIVAVFEEQASAVKSRPAFDEMKLRAHRGEFSCIIVWSLDRLGRRMVENLTTVMDLDRIGVRVISVREPWLDTQAQGPVRDLLLAIFSWVADQERRRISERTVAGLDRARRRGARIGRPRASLPEHELKRALELRAQGVGVRKIAQRLSTQIGASTLHRLLQAHDQLEAAKSERPKTGYSQSDTQPAENARAA